mmetsp:Transcript_7853/g.9471  ORF Transcript_7853/g.9471 Transcript_7853/m.9471 type:complete len:98 (+) Transcript_7853:682-975(+)
MNILFDQYLLSLGEFNQDGYMAPGADRAVLWIFIVSTFITNVTFFNMIIAIMSDTFARVSEKREQSALKEKISILADYAYIVPTKNEVDDHRFMFTL